MVLLPAVWSGLPDTPVIKTYANSSRPTLSGTYRFFSISECPYEDVEGVEQAMTLAHDKGFRLECGFAASFVPWGTIS